MGWLASFLGGAWRALWTPKAVRDYEDAVQADPRSVAAAGLEPPPPPLPVDRELEALDDRLTRVARTNTELEALARLYQRARPGPRPPTAPDPDPEEPR